MIRFLVMDVDGTLTDGKIYMSENGELFKAFDVKDGCGIKDILPTLGIIPIIITARNSEILRKRCEELNITNLYQGVNEKKKALIEFLEYFSIEHNSKYNIGNCAYIGDDILDLQCMIPIKESGGIIGCPNDAISEVKAISNFVSQKNGGNGAVREFIEWIKRCHVKY